jgi:thiol-disulfide isomerase/thioredoxin
MRRIGLVLVLLTAGCAQDQQIEFADGTRTQMSHWQDRWLVINYWAEWCAPCRHEIPELNALHERRVEHGVVVLGVNWDGLTGTKLAEVIERMGVGFPTLRVDPYLDFGYERARQLPVTVLINPAREVHKVLIGPQTQKSILGLIQSTGAQ